MALRNVVLEGDEILRKKCREVTQIDDRIRGILDDMVETMREYNGVGIAAPQVGVMRRMIVIEIDDEEVIELINPEILETRGCVGADEGCLSVPGYIGYVERPEYVKITGLDRYGNQVVHEGEGLKAVAFCHENDHLDGVLYVDKAKNFRKVEEE
ncbi:peptide deformylase [Clostridium aminobutyricum]|uniref:Peptide deformylase n=1 Tax=Clostridium aminobutyricum TaxID=33953 RepID=A0A939IHJ4_CLOAM|nr:peptide deformylase [Clostridium aminobutyricum]MBN7772046.1 peptide deformylase [Clostridium aminobutyricum]